jgi:hypothetical protein
MKLTNENYYTQEMNLEYMSASQFKDFMKCELNALDNIKKPKEPTKDMLVGSYVDAFFTDDFEKFKENTPQIFKKDGTLLKDFEKANDIIQAISQDKMFYDAINGEHQAIMTGEISGVKFKIKIDSLLSWAIVDLKVMASILEKIWDETRHRYVDFVEKYGYDIIGAIYQEIVRQNIGKKLPFILAVATKEDGIDKALIQIDQYYLDKALDFVKENCEHYDMVKKGLIKPSGCGHCVTCRKAKKVSEILSYQELFGKEIENEND